MTIVVIELMSKDVQKHFSTTVYNYIISPIVFCANLLDNLAATMINKLQMKSAPKPKTQQ